MDPIGNRTRDLPNCNALSQQNAPPPRLYMFHQSSEQATDYKQQTEFIPDIREFKLEYFTNAFNKLIYYKQRPDASYLILSISLPYEYRRTE
jgi:hypothetical protein